MDAKRGIILKLLATLAVTIMFACVRALEGGIPTGEVVFFRSIFALLPLILWYGVQGDLRRMIRTKSVWRHFGRGLTGTSAMYFNYLALAYLPLAQLTAFSYAAPIFTVVFAALLLREVVRIYRWGAVALGFAGVLVMLLPSLVAVEGRETGQSQVFLIGAGAALFAAACSALSVIQIRRMAASEDPAAIVFWFAVLTTLLGLATAAFGWAIPDTQQLLLLIGLGLFGGLAQVLMVLALKATHASLLAPFEYVGMVWAMLIGFFAFDALPDVYTITGAAIVAAAGLLTIWREHHLSRTVIRQAQAASDLVRNSR